VLRRADALVRRLPGGRATATVAVVLATVPFLLSPQPEDQLLAATVNVAPAAAESSPTPAAPNLPAPPGLRTAVPDDGVTGAGDAQSIQQSPGLAEQVRPLAPDLLVRPERPLNAEGLFAVLGVDGVEHLAAGAEVGVEVAGEKTNERITLLVVDPLAFRPLTPESTAQAKAVWERLHDGDLVVRHDVAERLGLPLGGEVVVNGQDGSATMRVGAYASNGAPPLADGIVSWATGSRLGVRRPNVLVIAVADDRKADDVGVGVSKALGGAGVTPLEQPEQQRAQLLGAGATRFEPFGYIDHGDGMIAIDPAWVRRWIVRAEVPIFGEVSCHRYMIPQLREAFQEVVDRGLDAHIDRSQYGGCWVPRHMLFDPANPISMHAWGIAIDFNVSTNQYGAQPQLDRRIVEVFERWGFRWGGTWRTPDGMHFELRTIMTN
ncbi:MAG: M15 family metallopeptidase, partial [Nitriliruptorales bacterium]